MFYYLEVNPEPWAVGPLSIGKRNGKMFPKIGRNAQLDSFKEAVREELESQGVKVLEWDFYILNFYFWRRLDDYETASGRRARKHQVDATNLQKATEDALQGVLIDNDRNVQRVSSEIIQQGKDVTPGIVIEIYEYDQPNCTIALNMRQEALDNPRMKSNLSDNSWPPSEGF